MSLSTRWWGWGDQNVSFGLTEHPGVLKYLKERFGIHTVSPSQALLPSQVKLAPSRLSESALSRLSELVGPKNLLLKNEERLPFAAGKSYFDLIRIRRAAAAGITLNAPDAILVPGSEQEIQGVLQCCQELGIAVVPFGGGSSVVGGVEPCSGRFDSVIALSLRRMNQVSSVDTVSRTAEIGAGCSGPELEQALNAQGYFLGHFPQSFEFSTLGGWLAARSSGQNSLGYGAAEKMVVSLKAITPKGEIKTIDAPSYACGPDWRQVLIGSEGTLGVIVSARVRVRPLPEVRDYFMVAFPGFNQATLAARDLVQRGNPPCLIRVSDEVESKVMLGFRDDGSLKSRLAGIYLRARGLSPEGPLSFLLVGFEGTRKSVRSGASSARQLLRNHGALMLGRSPGKRWLAERFRLPYLRDELMDQNLFLETLETVTEWSNIEHLHRTVRDTLSTCFGAKNLPCDVYCHISHLYPDGASLYFTVLGKTVQDPEAQWRELKRAANHAIQVGNGAISHHHGVGTDHRESLGWGPVEQKMASSLKEAVDPSGILNPGKLYPP